MGDQPTTLDKAVKVSIIAGALIIALSIAYYLVIFMPQKEKARIEQQKQEQIAQLEKEKQQKEDKLRAECVEEKKELKKQYNDFLASCENELCVKNTVKDSSVYVPTDYIQTCLDRKLKGLPTFGY